MEQEASRSHTSGLRWMPYTCCEVLSKGCVPPILCKMHQRGYYCPLQQGSAPSHFPPCSIFLRSFLNLWGKATHNPFSMKNSSSEKDKVKRWRNKIQSLLRLHWKDFQYDFSLFFFFSQRSRGGFAEYLLSLSDFPKFSTESHFSPQRAKQLLHLAAITENGD